MISTTWKPPVRQRACLLAGIVRAVIGGFAPARAVDHPSLPLRTRFARNRRWKTKEREVTIGSNPAARDAAIVRLKDWLNRHLGED